MVPDHKKREQMRTCGTGRDFRVKTLGKRRVHWPSSTFFSLVVYSVFSMLFWSYYRGINICVLSREVYSQLVKRNNSYGLCFILYFSYLTVLVYLSYGGVMLCVWLVEISFFQDHRILDA